MLNIKKDIDQLLESFQFVPQNLKDREEFTKQRELQKLEKILSQKVIQGDLFFYNNQYITDLGDIEEIHGSLLLWYCKNLTSLGNLKVVHGDLNLSRCINLKSLGDLQNCRTLYLSDTNINYIENKHLRVETIYKLDEYYKPWNSVEGFNDWHIEKGLI